MSAANRIAIYKFRDGSFATAVDTIVSAAPLHAVVAVYGGGGTKHTAGLAAVFGGAAVFRDDATGECHLGLWGARKAARFRKALKESGMDVEVIEAPPPGRLAWYQTG